jgi:Ser/Thr protein kinase RdoA (MazF antagonist)
MVGVIDPQIPAAVARSMSSIGIASARPATPGLSGARVYQCQLPSGQLLALKVWPPGTPRDRVEEVHRVLLHSRAGGCLLVPQLCQWPRDGRDREGTILTDASDEHWDLMHWMPGSPAIAELDQIRSGAAAIAQFHASIRALDFRVQRPPAAISRLQRLQELQPWVPATLRLAASRKPAAELGEAVQLACQLIQWKWNEVALRITRSLTPYADRQLATQYVLRDVHREHLLFSDQRVTGLIDFDAVRVDTPMTDLARWAGSFLAGNHPAARVWEAALAGFRQEETLIRSAATECDPHLARELCLATLWISVMNWLVWILVEQRSFPLGPQTIATRLRELAISASLGV